MNDNWTEFLLLHESNHHEEAREEPKKKGPLRSLAPSNVTRLIEFGSHNGRRRCCEKNPHIVRRAMKQGVQTAQGGDAGPIHRLGEVLFKCSACCWADFSAAMLPRHGVRTRK